MTSLIITAHPEKGGTTHFIAESYAQTKNNLGQQTEIIDLYTTDLKLDFFRLNNEINDRNVSIRHSKILDANELIFIFPIRRGESPAILKNRFDNVMIPGFAYKYINGKPVGLLNKKAKMFLTCDGPKIFFSIFPLSIKYFWKYMKLGFCGIKMTDFIIFDRMRIRKKKSDRKNKIINKINKIASKN